jgi:CheY-like chemotaxis protein
MTEESKILGEDFNFPEETKYFRDQETVTFSETKYGLPVNVCPVCKLNNYKKDKTCSLAHGIRQCDIRILVAEDAKEVSKFICRYIKKIANVQIDTAYDGQELVDMVKANKYYFIFSDISMPVFNGPDALIQCAKELGDTPIMLLTACQDEVIREHEKNMVDAGLNLVYTKKKPFTSEEIKGVVDKFFRGTP